MSILLLVITDYIFLWLLCLNAWARSKVSYGPFFQIVGVTVIITLLEISTNLRSREIEVFLSSWSPRNRMILLLLCFFCWFLLSISWLFPTLYRCIISCSSPYRVFRAMCSRSYCFHWWLFDGCWLYRNLYLHLHHIMNLELMSSLQG